VDAIADGDPLTARRAMEEHILGSWTRRRLPTSKQAGDSSKRG
jgi:DNA-binding FadR family transcriptional regulator